QLRAQPPPAHRRLLRPLRRRAGRERRDGDHAAGRRGDRHPGRPLHGMRRGVGALALGVLVAAAAACSGSAAPAPAPPACVRASRPAIPTAIDLVAPPPRARALCIARRYADVFTSGTGWSTTAELMR